ncbi:MAG: hypothetical protein WAV08_15260 [Desulfobacterales bacterium]
MALDFNPGLGVSLFGLRFELLDFGGYFLKFGLCQLLIFIA